MVKSALLVAPVAVLLCASAGPAVAHHSFAVYDTSQKLTLEGTVRQFLWQNPHSHIFLTVPKGDGTDATTDWDIESPAPNIMSRQGWNKQSLKTGDRIQVTLHPMRESSNAGVMMYAVVNGTTMYVDASRPAEAAAKPPAKQ